MANTDGQPATSGIDSNGDKVFLPLENNPTILNPLAHALGFSPDYAFHDLYSFSDPDLLAIIPRPALALLFVYPHTTKAEALQRAEVAAEPLYDKTGADPVLWFRQDIRNACGLMGTLHCTLNAHHALPPSTATTPPQLILPTTLLSTLQTTAPPLFPSSRTALLTNNPALEAHHTSAALQGDTPPLPLGQDPGHAFIAFVKGSDGIMYEMDGCRQGPKALGQLAEGEDLLSERALDMGARVYLGREAAWAEAESGKEYGNNGLGNGEAEREKRKGMEFSCTVLAPVA